MVERLTDEVGALDRAFEVKAERVPREIRAVVAGHRNAMRCPCAYRLSSSNRMVSTSAFSLIGSTMPLVPRIEMPPTMPR